LSTILTIKEGIIMIRISVPFRRCAVAFALARPILQRFFCADSGMGDSVATGRRCAFGLLFILCVTVFPQGCAKPYGTLVRHYREAPVCCNSMADLPVEPLLAGDKKNFELGANSPLYRFDTGRSFFRVFALPEGPSPYRVTVSSYLVGDYLKSSYIFSPQLITLDKDRKIVRSTGPGTFSVAHADFLESLRTGGGFHNKIEGGLTFTGTNGEERYLVVLTTDELLRGKTAFPSEEVPMLILGGSGGIPAKTSELLVPHSPGGMVSISWSSLATGKSAPGTGNIETVIVEIGAGSRKEQIAVTKPGVAGSRENAPAFVRPEQVTVRLASGRTIGSLDLGKTTMDEARRLFQDNGAGLGPERKNSTTFTIGATSLSPMRLYTPPGTHHQLFFDDNGVLVLFVDGFTAEPYSSSSEFRQHYTGVRETGRIAGSYELQADLAPCVTLIAVFRTVSDTLDSALFGYTCPTR
jgi:hypothetical protein